MKDIPCGMTRCQDDSTSVELVTVCCADSPDLFIVDHKTDHFLFKAQYTPAVDDLLPHRLDDLRKFVGTDMRMGIDKDRRRSTELNQEIKNTPDVTALRAAGI